MKLRVIFSCVSWNCVSSARLYRGIVSYFPICLVELRHIYLFISRDCISFSYVLCGTASLFTMCLVELCFTYAAAPQNVCSWSLRITKLRDICSRFPLNSCRIEERRRIMRVNCPCFTEEMSLGKDYLEAACHFRSTFAEYVLRKSRPSNRV